MRLERWRIVVVSNEPWDPIWYSKHHYASALAARNDVFFLDPAGRWSPRHLGGPALTARRVADRLEVIAYRNPLPGSGRVAAAGALNDRWVTSELRRYLARKGAAPLLVWTFDPLRFRLPRLLRPDFTIYQSMDHYRLPQEFSLCRSSDLVLAAAPAIAQRLSQSGVPVHLLSHAVEVPAGLVPTESSGGLVLVGTFGGRINYEILLQVARAFPDLELRLVGPLLAQQLSAPDAERVDALRRSPNVVFRGALDPKRMFEEIASARVCLCAYKEDDPGSRMNSHKILQYLAMGKPVVSSYLEAYAGESLVRLASPREFTEAVRDALAADDAEARGRRQAFAERHSYAGVITRIEALATEAERTRADGRPRGL